VGDLVTQRQHLAARLFDAVEKELRRDAEHFDELR
jgi:hypothetical protein